MYILPRNDIQPSEQSFLRPIFKSKPRTPLAFSHAQMTHFELVSDFPGLVLAFWNNSLLFQVRDMMKPYNFWKCDSLTKEADWWSHFHFLLTFQKSLSSLQVTHQSCYTVNYNDCHHCTKNIPGTSFQLIPFLKVEILVGESVYPHLLLPILSPVRIL